MTEPAIYTVGGTVQAGGGVYIKRKADHELLELCQQGEIALVLSSRQVGKSSLMVRTAQQLEANDIRSVIIDLSTIGVQVTQNEWYLGILNEIKNTLNLKTDIFVWWEDNAQLGSTQRLINFFQDVMLKEVDGRVVLFFDEIDSTLSIPFSDDFFAALRATYNARSITDEFKRLSFVLVGVATPSDLIIDRKRTPFNLGRRVELTDFTLAEARPLSLGLGKNPEMVLSWVLSWTGGHPYLTQRLCSHIAKRNETLTEQTLEAAVKQLFTGEQGWHDNNLQFVRDMLTKRAPNVHRILKIYKEIRAGKPTHDDERSLLKAHLKISGIVRRQGGYLILRNRIYENAFDLAWIEENTPPLKERRFVIASSLVTIAALITAAFFAYQAWTRPPADRFELGFLAAGNPPARLMNLAGLFALGGEENAFRARNLFYSLSQEQKLELFGPVNESAVKDQETVALGIYETLGFKPEVDEMGDELLLKIRDAMRESKPELASEAGAWLQGRNHLNKEEYIEAKDALGRALLINPNNPALYYDRARAFMGMGESYYPDALEDLNRMVRESPSRSAAARRLINGTMAFNAHWEANKQKYPLLAEVIPIQEVLIPAGNFTMGSDANEAFARCHEYSAECSRSWFKNEEPPHVIYLDSFYIDKYEVTNALYAECVQEDVCKPPANSESSTRKKYFGAPDYAKFPVIYVSWFDADTYCEWRGAHLPTEAQWEKAARENNTYLFPWGDKLDCAYANFDQCVGDTTEVGSYEIGQSPYGVYDMTGNVWEWVADWYSETYYSNSLSSNPLGPDSGQFRVLRGGPWNGGYNRMRSANRGINDPPITNDFIGFRCAQNIAPEP